MKTEFFTVDLEEIKEIGLAATYHGGNELKERFGKAKQLERKGLIDLLTEADIASEKAIISTIHKAFPEHHILAEESGDNKVLSECKWIIDPLDGTTNYAHRIPIFSVSIGFAYKDELLFGSVLNPITEELFLAVKGEGASLNGNKIEVSRTSKLEESLLVTGFSYSLKQIVKPTMAKFERIILSVQGVRRLGSAALDLCYVACGRFEGFWEQNLAPWDTAAGFLIAEEAGARITNFSKGTYTIYQKELVATNGKIHDELVSMLQ